MRESKAVSARSAGGNGICSKISASGVYRSHMRKQYIMEVESVNMKKTFPEGKGEKKGIKDFLEKKGFYVVLLMCIAIVVGTAIFVSMRGTAPGGSGVGAEAGNGAEGLADAVDGNMPVEDVVFNEADGLPGNAAATGDGSVGADAAGRADEPAEPGQAGIGDAAAVGGEAGTGAGTGANAGDTAGVVGSIAEPEDTGDADVADADGVSDADAVAANSTPVAQQSFAMPVDGPVLMNYAMDKLVYSKTLEEWRAHAGIDISADRGTPVKAVADGVVSDIMNDRYYGITVVIDHENDLRTLYRNLSSDDMVTVNQKVKQGEIIGNVGNTAMDESAEQPHLHFEVRHNGEVADPAAFLPALTE